MNKNTDAGDIDSKTVLRPVLGLLEGLETSQVQEITIDAILKHRLLRDEASASHIQMEKLQGMQARPEQIRFAECAYVTAMIAMHAHQTALSTLLDVLGYIPDVPRPEPSN